MKINIGTIRKMFTLVPTLAALVAGLKTIFADPGLAAEVKANPVAQVVAERISREWRTVEEAETKLVRKSSFLTVIGNIRALANAANVLRADAAAEEHDPALAAALAGMPLTKAALASFEGEIEQAEAEIAALVE